MDAQLAKRRDDILDVIDDFGTQKAFAEAIDMDPSRISRALNKDHVSDRRLAPIERAIAKLQSGQGDGDSGEVPAATLSPSAPREAGGVDVVRVPVFADAGAGPGRLPQKQSGGAKRYVTVSLTEFVQHFRTRPTDEEDLRRFGYFEVTGRSAAPFYFDGELVPVELLDEPTQDFRNDTLYVYRWRGHLYMKVLRRAEDGETIRAVSLNRSIEPYEFTPQNGHDFAVVARVIETEKQQLYDTLVHRFLRTGEETAG
jgi:phage repressor protein C with HTH and peptisase S24 domain